MPVRGKNMKKTRLSQKLKFWESLKPQNKKPVPGAIYWLDVFRRFFAGPLKALTKMQSWGNVPRLKQKSLLESASFLNEY
jgi:hypothetical protein